MLPSQPATVISQYQGMDTVIAVVVVFMLIVLAIGYWATRKTKNAHDFFIAGKSIGTIALALAAFSATMSGWLFVGNPGLISMLGTSSMWFTITTGVCFTMLFVVLGKRMRLLAEIRDIMTVADAVEARYKSKTARALAALATLLGTVLYLATQVLAIGVVLGYVFNISVAWGAVIGMVVVIAYSVGGGILAGIYSDVFQGLMMAVASIAIFILAIDSGGGMENIAKTISESAALAKGGLGQKFVGPFGILPPIIVLNWFFLLAMGVVGQPHIVHKFFMVKNVKKLKWGPLMTTVPSIIAGILGFGVGMAVKSLILTGKLAPLAKPDDAITVFLLHYTTPLLTGIAFAGIASAVMSTADSFINIASAAAVRDIPAIFNKKLTEKQSLFWGRVTVAVVGVLSVVIALSLSKEGIALLGAFGFGALAAALGPILAIGFNWKRVTRKAAILSMILGMAFSIILELARKMKAAWYMKSFNKLGIHPAALGLLIGFIVLIVVSFLSKPDKLDKDIEAVMDA